MIGLSLVFAFWFWRKKTRLKRSQRATYAPELWKAFNREFLILDILRRACSVWTQFLTVLLTCMACLYFAGYTGESIAFGIYTCGDFATGERLYRKAWSILPSRLNQRDTIWSFWTKFGSLSDEKYTEQVNSSIVKVYGENSLEFALRCESLAYGHRHRAYTVFENTHSFKDALVEVYETESWSRRAASVYFANGSMTAAADLLSLSAQAQALQYKDVAAQESLEAALAQLRQGHYTNNCHLRPAFKKLAHTAEMLGHKELAQALEEKAHSPLTVLVQKKSGPLDATSVAILLVMSILLPLLNPLFLALCRLRWGHQLRTANDDTLKALDLLTTLALYDGRIKDAEAQSKMMLAIATAPAQTPSSADHRISITQETRRRTAGS
jgi:hypothetical protein